MEHKSFVLMYLRVLPGVCPERVDPSHTSASARIFKTGFLRTSRGWNRPQFGTFWRPGGAGGMVAEIAGGAGEVGVLDALFLAFRLRVDASVDA
jgi:hypothetical protein